VITQAIASVSVAVLTYRYFVRRFEGRQPSELSGKGVVHELSIGVGLGALLFSVAIAVLSALGAFSLTGRGKTSAVPFAVLASVAAAVTEELLFRGLLLRLLESAFGSYFALIASSAVFGLVHLLSPNPTLLGVVAIILEAGLLLGSAFIATRRLWLPIGLHFGWNFTQGGVFGTAVSGTPTAGILQGRLSGPEWLSGGAFGAEASVVSVALCLVLVALFLRYAHVHNRITPLRRTGNVPLAALNRGQ
jgi:membrane protease YdiL (CAAX protease family)